MRYLPIALALMLAGCSSTPEKKPTAVAPAPATVKDHRMLLLAEHQTSAAVVSGHLLDNKTLPGGSLGEYETGGKKYQLFVIEAAGTQEAAFVMFDFKGTLKNPEYIAYMGGYFGTLDNTPPGQSVYVFAKKQYLAGVVGLSREAADPIARQLAAKL